MDEKILLVDDDQSVLDAITRQLRKRFSIDVALSAQQALEMMRVSGPYAVIVSDMRMPGMDGVQLLTIVKDTYPETIRLMLTGNADQETATEAVNKGQIFRFLNKPCSTATLATSIALALRQFRLVTAEKELLDQTLSGTINVLSGLLSLTNPMAFRSASRIKVMVLQMARELKLDDIWQYEIAAMLSQVGCVSFPSTILNKVQTGEVLDEDEKEMFANHPMVGASLIENIPRLEKVAQMIAFQLLGYEEFAEKAVDEDIALGAQILRIAIDYDLLLTQGKNHHDAVAALKAGREEYNPEILQTLKKVKRDKSITIAHVTMKDIQIGMVADEDILAKNGVLLSPKGQEITWAVLQGLKNFNAKVGVKEPIRVCVDNG